MVTVNSKHHYSTSEPKGDDETTEDEQQQQQEEDEVMDGSKEKKPLNDNNSSSNDSRLIGEAVVSVVTTKSVVNGTVSLPVTLLPMVTEQIVSPPTESTATSTTEEPLPADTTEDSSRILASVQTSRSISGNNKIGKIHFNFTIF